MDQNPYAAPSEESAQGVLSGRREDVMAVARYQKGVLVCILIQFAVMAGFQFAPPAARPFVSIAFLLAALTSAIFVILLAMKVYHPAVGVLMGVLSMVPCLGLLVLLLINQRATTILNSNGIKVGLLGAKT